MRIALGSDHRGFPLKALLGAALAAQGHEVRDVGPASGEGAADYPLYAGLAARLVAGGEAEAGIVICGSGVGVAIAANKVPGVRAVNAHDPLEAEMARRHNDANVLALAGDRLDPVAAEAILAAFLGAGFEGGRHARRVDLIRELEGAPAGVPVAAAVPA